MSPQVTPQNQRCASIPVSQVIVRVLAGYAHRITDFPIHRIVSDALCSRITRRSHVRQGTCCRRPYRTVHQSGHLTGSSRNAERKVAWTRDSALGGIAMYADVVVCDDLDHVIAVARIGGGDLVELSVLGSALPDAMVDGYGCPLIALGGQVCGFNWRTLKAYKSAQKKLRSVTLNCVRLDKLHARSRFAPPLRSRHLCNLHGSGDRADEQADTGHAWSNFLRQQGHSPSTPWSSALNAVG